MAQMANTMCVDCYGATENAGVENAGGDRRGGNVGVSPMDSQPKNKLEQQ